MSPDTYFHVVYRPTGPCSPFFLGAFRVQLQGGWFITADICRSYTPRDFHDALGGAGIEARINSQGIPSNGQHKDGLKFLV